MPTIYRDFEIDVTLDDFNDEDLIDELDRRGKSLDFRDSSPSELVEKIYFKRRIGQDYQRELDDLIYEVVGKII